MNAAETWVRTQNDIVLGEVGEPGGKPGTSDFVRAERWWRPAFRHNHADNRTFLGKKEKPSLTVATFACLCARALLFRTKDVCCCNETPSSFSGELFFVPPAVDPGKRTTAQRPRTQNNSLIPLHCTAGTFFHFQLRLLTRFGPFLDLNRGSAGTLSFSQRLFCSQGELG